MEKRGKMGNLGGEEWEFWNQVRHGLDCGIQCRSAHKSSNVCLCANCRGRSDY